MTPTSSQKPSPELEPVSLNHIDSKQKDESVEDETAEEDKSHKDQHSTNYSIQMDLPNGSQLMVNVQVSVQIKNPTPTAMSPHHTQRYVREFAKFMRHNPRL